MRLHSDASMLGMTELGAHSAHTVSRSVLDAQCSGISQDGLVCYWIVALWAPTLGVG